MMTMMMTTMMMMIMMSSRHVDGDGRRGGPIDGILGRGKIAGLQYVPHTRSRATAREVSSSSSSSSHHYAPCYYPPRRASSFQVDEGRPRSGRGIVAYDDDDDDDDDDESHRIAWMRTMSDFKRSLPVTIATLVVDGDIIREGERHPWS